MSGNILFSAFEARRFRVAGNAAYGALGAFPAVAEPFGSPETATYKLTVFTANNTLCSDKRFTEPIDALGSLALCEKTRFVLLIHADETAPGAHFAQTCDALGQHLAACELLPPDRCPICSKRGCDAFALYGESYQPMHAQCADDLIAYKNSGQLKGSYFTGLLGGIAGGLIGAVPSIATIYFYESIWSLLYALIPLSVYQGYKLCGGKLDRVSIGINLTLSLLDIYVIQCAVIVLSLMKAYELSLYEAARELLSVAARSAFWIDVTEASYASFFFLALGLLIAWNRIAATVEVKAGLSDQLAATRSRRDALPR